MSDKEETHSKRPPIFTKEELENIPDAVEVAEKQMAEEQAKRKISVAPKASGNAPEIKKSIPKVDDEDPEDENEVGKKVARQKPMTKSEQFGHNIAHTIAGTIDSVGMLGMKAFDKVQTRTKDKQISSLNAAVSEVSQSKQKIEAHLKSHNDSFRSIGNKVQRTFEDPGMKKRFPDETLRRREAMKVVAADHPEAFTSENVENYKSSLERIKELSASYAASISSLTRQKTGLEKADPALKHAASQLLSEAGSPTSPLQRAKDAGTINGKPDEGLKKHLDEMIEKIMQMVRMILEKVFGITSSDAMSPKM